MDIREWRVLLLALVALSLLATVAATLGELKGVAQGALLLAQETYRAVQGASADIPPPAEEEYPARG